MIRKIKISNAIFMVFILISLIISGNCDEPKCPDLSKPTGTCSEFQRCQRGSYCYRDLETATDKSTDKTFYCCQSYCPDTGMVFGKDYNPKDQSMMAYCDKESDHHYPLTLKTGTTSHGRPVCCPKPYSAFVYAKHSGLLGNDTITLPRDWKIDETTGRANVTNCCTVDDCGKDEYCGRVWSPSNYQYQVERRNGTLCLNKYEQSKFFTIDQFLRYCYKIPTETPPLKDLIYYHKNDNFNDEQLCKKLTDCWNSTRICKLFDGYDTGYCRLGLEWKSEKHAAEEVFLLEHVNGQVGCRSDKECQKKGKNWFSYKCEPALHQQWKICVGYELLCSETAYQPHGLHFGCQSDQECDRKTQFSGYSGHCTIDKINETKKACCYEMNTCQLEIDVHPHGLAPENRRMCKEDWECEKLAKDLEKADGEYSRTTYWARCMPELKNGFGKCCIANMSTVCPVGRSLIPPINCTTDNQCGGELDKSQWCGDNGFCCQDFPDDPDGYLCPDKKTIRNEQPFCSGAEYCNFGTGICLMNRCCPLMSRESDILYVWAESPWYFPSIPCNDTSDLPADLEMVYCDPIRNIAARVSRTDRWHIPTMTIDKFCEKNRDCSESLDFVCVQELKGVQRCHTYYDRQFHYLVLLWPISGLIAILLTYILHWRKVLKKQVHNEQETMR